MCKFLTPQPPLPPSQKVSGVRGLRLTPWRISISLLFRRRGAGRWGSQFIASSLKPGFHIVVSVVSVVSVIRKKFIGQIKLYENLPYKCSIQKKWQIQLFVRDRMNSICPMNFFHTTDTTDTTDTTIWKPGFITETSMSSCPAGRNKTHICPTSIVLNVFLNSNSKYEKQWWLTD